MNEFSSETLTKLQLGIINKEILSQFSLPFKNVEILAIEIHTDIDGIKLSELPHLEDFSIAYSNL